MGQFNIFVILLSTGCQAFIKSYRMATLQFEAEGKSWLSHPKKKSRGPAKEDTVKLGSADNNINQYSVSASPLMFANIIKFTV